jgi:hypothetical protein
VDNTQAMLKELSGLSKNLDVLVQELKSTNKAVKENSEDIRKLSEERRTESTKPAEQSDSPFKNLVRGLTDSIKESFKEQILSQEGIFNLLQKNIDSTKSQENKPNPQVPNYGELIKSVFSKIPKLEAGGEITKSGAAIVGEKGPELVQLKAGSVVSPNDELMKILMQDKEAPKNFETLNNEFKKSNESSIVTGKPELNDFVTNSFGVKVPKSEIEKYRKEIYDEFKEDFDADPKLLEDEMKIFVDNYRESFSAEEMQKLAAKAEIPKKPETSPTISNEEQSKIEKDKEERKKKIIDKEKLQTLIGSKLPEKFQSFLENKPQTITNNQTASEPGKSMSTNEISSGLQALTEKLKKDNPNMEFAKDMQTLKSKETRAVSSPSTTPSNESQNQIISSPSSEIESKPVVEKKQKQPIANTTGDSGGVISQQDVKDIKALLTGIYRQLSGPLNIANDSPFRPNSNVL